MLVVGEPSHPCSTLNATVDDVPACIAQACVNLCLHEVAAAESRDALLTALEFAPLLVQHDLVLANLLVRFDHMEGTS